ncbi:hypothetical protein [Mucilaginibacter auburnensis]|uniref:Uncharacterized protein n=1 Tax=Mucilaginibacter auburnensis TaxID=1457233 RepID=A0A2H9VW14_9SPHI|nr:hypothetical protein [Mucilaginibacter auburnensis]PJJ84969.1 hypothetical protein CLV57_1991 [Mucilaginibacter auburnensis]
MTCCTLTNAQSVWSNKSRVLPDKLQELPVGVLLWHNPNPCYPELIDSTYYWKHSTSAMSVAKNLKVIECGSFIWYNEKGWQSNVRLSTDEFAKAFNCKGGRLKPNKTFTYEKNWRYGKQAYGGDALWYIIAEDSNGTRYKGYALIETEGKILNANN